MRRAVAAVALVAAAFFGVTALGDATQTRPDERRADRKTEVVINLAGRNYRQSLDTAATVLWGSCAATVGGHLVDPGIEPLGDGSYRFAMTPALGRHAKERLLGCLGDLTVDRISSHVASVADVPL